MALTRVVIAFVSSCTIYDLTGSTSTSVSFLFSHYCVFSALEMSYGNALYKSILNYIRLHYIRLQTVYCNCIL